MLEHYIFRIPVVKQDLCLIKSISCLSLCFVHVDDTFAIFKQEGDVDDFLVTFNRLHYALKFTFEKEPDGKLLFLDILMERAELGFETRVYRKPTFFGKYIRWESFNPRKWKTKPNRNAGTQEHLSEVQSSMTSLASRTSSRTHFEVFGLCLEGQVLGLESSSSRKLPCPRLEDSTSF